MNFLLHLIGRANRAAVYPVLRPTPQQMMERSAAKAAMRGEFAAAVGAYADLGREKSGRLVEILIRAHLHLAAQDYAAASHFFSVGIARIDGKCVEDSFVSEFRDMIFGDESNASNRKTRGDSLERMIDAADEHLRQGRYVRALELFQKARTGVDTLLAANGGMILADARVDRDGAAERARPLIALAKLGDLLLRMLARTHLASNVAIGLRQRDLRADLAPWATRGEDVDGLLEGELEMLRAEVEKQPDHAEMHYRLGLVARAAGELEVAERAFTRVVQLQPHHVLSATRLAATLLQLGKTEAVMGLLAVAFAVPAETLERYDGLAAAAGSGERGMFDRAVMRLCHDLGKENGSGTVRANLAFALGELGLLDEERAAWREAAVV